MATLQFYATPNDHREILRFILEETDCQIFECYSRINEELRRIENLQAFESEFQIDVSKTWPYLAIISPCVTSSFPQIERFDLSEFAGGGFRHRIAQPGVIALQGKGIKDAEDSPLGWSSIGHLGKNGTRARSTYPDSMLDTLNWQELERVARRIRYHISSRLGVAKHRNRPILNDAYRQMQSGLKIWSGPDSKDIESGEIQPA